MSQRTPKLYDDLAVWWPLLSAPAEYAEEAGFYRQILEDASHPRTVLELGSGGGNNASHLKRHFSLTLVDRSSGMLAVSRALNPECEHIQGDMREVRLDREFDAVFVHDAVMYLTTEPDLGLAIETAFVHCRRGGAALLVPDWFRESYSNYTDRGGHDGPDRSLRYLEWVHDEDPADDVFTVDFAIMLRTKGEPVRLIHDHHVCGLFARERWLAVCRRAGFRPEIMTIVHSDLAPQESEVILCRKP